MLVRGDEFRRSIRVVLDAFGGAAGDFVIVGSCVLGLYARTSGSPLRATKDVDCISRRVPWSAQLAALAEMVTRGVLAPDPKLACRYAIRGTDVVVDVMSKDGANVPTTAWFEAAAKNAREYDAGDGRKVAAVAPAYFLALKLEALHDRAVDLFDKDAEDMVTLAVEVPTLVREVRAAGIASGVAALWARAFTKLRFSTRDLEDVVDAHLHRDDVAHRQRVVEALVALAVGDGGGERQASVRRISSR